MCRFCIKSSHRERGWGQRKRVEVEERVSKRFNKVDLTFSMIQEEAELWRAVGQGYRQCGGVGGYRRNQGCLRSSRKGRLGENSQKGSEKPRRKGTEHQDGGIETKKDDWGGINKYL